MTEAEIELIAEGWIRYQLSAEGSAERAANCKFVSSAFDIREGDPKLLWRLILAIHARDQSDDVQCKLSAGPLEDLLSYHGPAFIDVVEQQGNDDPAFAKLLDGAHRHLMSEDVWGRVTNKSNR